MRLELRPDGYERIDAAVQDVEDEARGGAFDSRDAVPRFQRIVSELKKLRQVLREVIIIDPSPAERGAAEAGGPDAA